MSTILVESPDSSAGTVQKRSAPAWLREPLLHFIVLGAVLFAADHLFASRKDDPRTIVVDASVDQHAIQVFKDARGRDPNSEELYALRKVWLDNEVLYREGIALGLDRGDTAIRERVIFKALSMVDAGTKLPTVDESILRAWFDSHRDKYDEPARYDFEEAIVAGDRSDIAVRAFAQALNSGAPGDTQADLRVFTARPQGNIVQSYGDEFAKSLAAAPVGEWQALPSKGGMRAIRLKSMTAAKPATFEDVGGIVMQDWTDSVMADQRSAAVAALAKKYKVEVTGAP